ncbi:MAG: Gfo/Idh/MocA family oxidoreductase [Anaerolineae bacterium]|nr:Gfo/Idh/MocA family oxidoreductase [Anaerolineae bacterium]
MTTADKFRWGILGTGNIARLFARGLKAIPDAALVAVGSRAQASADAFGDEFGVPRRHAGYEALAGDPEVDAIYVATPHSLHAENTLLCLDAGKPVICEKPFAINTMQAKQMVARARERKLFLMEAMWTRFLPAMVRARELLAAGAIGEVRMVMADFGFRTNFNPKGRLFNPALGGGGLLDVGVYPVSLASMVFGGPPTRMTGMATLGATGVDEQASMTLGYKDGQIAVLATGIRTQTPHIAYILGAEGHIYFPPRWWHAAAFTLSVNGKADETFELPYEGNGYNYEAVEVMACVRAGRLESDTMPLDETLQIMQTLDAIRAQWGLKYPME